MTPSARLRELVQAATPGKWIPLRDGEVVTVCTDDGGEVLPWHEGAEQVSEADARLIALAPELAAWAADAADELQRVEEGPRQGYTASALLARLEELLPERGE